jgi:high-affinity nickel-transport protein
MAVGGIEALQLIGDRLGLQGTVWRFVAALSENFSLVGYSIVGFFIVSWIASYLLYKARGYDRI